MRFQRRFLATLSSLLVVFPVKTAFNCVEYFSTDQIRVVHFFKDIFEFNDLYPFIYETEHWLYSSEFIEKQLSEADRININEWKRKMKDPEISDKDIVSFLYELQPAVYWKNQDEWDRNNRFLYIAKTKYPDIYTYLQFVKEVEILIGSGTANTWNEENVFSGQGKYIPVAEKLLAKTTDPFLKRRYAYKLLSLRFYDIRTLLSDEHADTAVATEQLFTLFDRYFKKGEKDWMYYSALHYYGQLKGKEYLLESYRYGKDKRARTATLLTDSFLSQTIALNANPQTVAACIAIRSLSNPGRNLKELQHIYALDPQNRDFNFLVSREVNKLENWLWTEKISKLKFDDYYYYDDEEIRQYALNHKSDYTYSGEVVGFLKQVYNNPRIADEDRLFLAVSIAYTEVVRGNYDAAKQYLDTDPKMYKNPRYYLQAKVINILLRMYMKGADAAFENELLALFSEIRSCGYFDSPDLYVDQMVRTVGEYYKTQPALRARGFLLSSRSALARNGTFFMDDVYEHASVKDIDGMFSVIHKKDKSPFEQFITSGSQDWRYDYLDPDDRERLTPLDTMRFLDYKGLRLMREDRLEEALAIYATLSDSVLNERPFSYIRDDVFIFRYRHAGEFLYNKKTFLEQLIRYKQILAKDPANPLIIYYVGNAYLNMTIHGNAWPMMSNYVSSDVEYREYAAMIGHHYIYGDRAIPYFKNALAHVKDPKLKALIQINLGFIASIRIEDEDKQLIALRKLCTDKTEEKLLMQVYSNCDLYYDYTQQYTRKGDRIAPPNKWGFNYY